MINFEGLSLKEIRAAVATHLQESLAGLKELTGDKKFSAKIKKASKLLTEDVHLKKGAKSKKAVIETVEKEALPQKVAKKADPEVKSKVALPTEKASKKSKATKVDAKKED